MRGAVAGSSGREFRELIDVLVDEGASLAEIERELLEEAPVSEDLRDALWLYAWSRLGRQSPAAALA